MYLSLDNLIKKKIKSIVVDDSGTVESSSADGFLMIFFTIGPIIVVIRYRQRLETRTCVGEHFC